MTEVDLKIVLKDALKEWLEEKFTAFGKWSFYSILAMAFSALVYFTLTMNGFHK